MLKKVQSQFIVVGLVLTTSIIIFFDFIVVNVWQTSKYIPIGMMSTLIFVGLTSYAITRYRFMDIIVVLKKSIVYGVALLVSAVIFFGAATWIYFRMDSILVWAIAIILATILTQPFKRRVKMSLDSIFFMDEFDLSKNLSEKVKKLSTTHELGTFILEFASSIQEVVKADVLDVLVLQRQHNRFAAYYPKNSKFALSFDDDITKYLAQQPNVIIKEEVAQGTDLQSRKLLRWMQKRNAEVLLLVKPTYLAAIILLSPKKTQEPYTTVEIKRLERLLKTARANIPNLLYWHETLETVRIKLKEDAYQGIE